MNKEAQAYLDKILAKTPKELSEYEIGFLRARSSYLNKTQLEEYKDVLFNKQVQVLTRKELEAIAIELGIENPSNKKLYETNKILEEAIKAKREKK